jgi:hypothetical protein
MRGGYRRIRELARGWTLGDCPSGAAPRQAARPGTGSSVADSCTMRDSFPRAAPAWSGDMPSATVYAGARTRRQGGGTSDGDITTAGKGATVGGARRP